MLIYVNTIADLKSSTVTPTISDPYLAIIVGGYYYVGDGGGGTFVYNDSFDGTPGIPSFWHDDGGLIIAHDDYATNNVWYKRLVHEPYLSVKWFGAYGDDYHDDIDAIRRTFEASYVPYPYWGYPVLELGNVQIGASSSPIGLTDGSRTTIYFPAGVYKISDSIAYSNLSPYDHARYFEIIGERSVIRPYDENYTRSHWAMDLENVWHMRIAKISFLDFYHALKLDSNNLDGGTVTIEDVHFSDIKNIAVHLECQSSYVVFNNCNWRGIHELALYQVACDRCVINGGWITIVSFPSGLSPFELYAGTLHMYNMICVEPYPSTADSNNAAWVRIADRPSSLLMDSMRFGGEAGGIGLVNSYVVGNNWDETWRFPMGITIRNCNCPTYGYNGGAIPVRLFEVPNFVVFEDNKGFTSKQPIIWIADWLDLAPWRGLFSIKLDNIAYAYHKLDFNQYHNLYNTVSITSPDQKRAQLDLLPFVRVNNGLESYGYMESDSGAFKPLVFFGGFMSYEVTYLYGAISGDYSFEVRMSNVASGGAGYQYSCYRIETTYDSGLNTVNINAIVDLTGNTDVNAPMLQATGKLVEASTNGEEPYEIYYEIRNLIPPVVRPFGGIS